MTTRLVSGADLYHLVVVATLVAAGALPSSRAREALAVALGWVAGTGSVRKRRQVERSLATAFGGSPDRRVVHAVFRGFWREMLCWTAPPPGVAVVGGLEHLREALDAGRGAILWESNGFGPRLLIKQALHARGLPVHQVHGPNDLGGFLVRRGRRTWIQDAVVRRFFDGRERRFVARIIHLPDTESLAFTRDLLACLQRNAILCIAGDGREGQRLVPIRFLGRTVGFSPGMVSLSRLCGAPLLPVFCAPGDDGAPAVTIEPPIRVDGSAEREVAQQRALEEFAARLEAQVRRRPGLYRNWHVLDDRRDGGGEVAVDAGVPG